MKRDRHFLVAAILCFIVAFCAIPAFSQTTGALLPAIPPSFLNASGLVAANAKLCTLKAGTTTTWLSTYSDDALQNALPNPVTMNALGVPTTGNGTSTQIYISGASGGNYKVILYAAGTGNTCNGTAVGAVIWTRDNVYDLGELIIQGLVTITALNNRQFCVTGATADLKAIAALAALPSTGGIADCTNLTGSQTFASEITIGANKTLLLGAATFNCTVTSSECITLSGANAQLIGQNPNFGSITQSTGAAGQSVVSLTATGTLVDGINVTGSVLSGHEGDEEVACFHVKGAAYPASLSHITIQNSSCTGKVSGIWTYNGVNSFALTNIVIKNNTIRSTWDGIYVGGYGQNAIVNNDVLIEDNNISIPATSTTVPSNWYNSRPLQAINSNNLRVIHNFAVGGFSGPETYAHPASPRMKDVQFIGNVSDGHNSFIQVDGGTFANNIVDMTLRNAGWITYDNAALVAIYGNMPGVEAADNNNVTVVGNSVRGQYGPCFDFSANGSSLTGNSMISCSQSVNHATNWPSYSGCILLNYTFGDAVVSNNSMSTCGTSAIKQIGVDSPAGTLTHVNITGNTITNAQQHGIHLRNIVDSTVANNIVNNPNLAASTYNAIDFTTDGGGNTYLVSGVSVIDNITSGGTYGVYQPYSEEGANRKNYIVNNKSYAASTAPFFIYGHRHGNTDGSANFGCLVTVGAGTAHVSTTCGMDVIRLDNGGGAKTVGFIDDGSITDTITFQAATGNVGNVTFVQAVNQLNMAGTANLALTPGSVVTLSNIQNSPTAGQNWQEVSRTIR